MDHAALLAAFTAQVRQRVSEAADHVVERDGPVVRHVARDRDGWSAVVWSDLGASDADAVIARQVAYFAARGQRFEWKYYDGDQPDDLPARLLAAGFQPDPPEALMVADVAGQPDTPPPPGVQIITVTDAAGIADVVSVHDQAFGTDHAELGAELTTQLSAAPETVDVVLAMAGNTPVSSARIEYNPGTEFAGLWGGGTVPEWRGRGLYRALVSYRAQLAAARGVKYLQVDASDESRPILSRLGFIQLGTTTPYRYSG